MTNELRLMLVLAHPDDESLGNGGMVAKYVAEGVDVHLVTATRGERGWFGPEDENPGPEELGRIREEELLEAAAVLGLTGPRYMARVFVPAILPSLVTGCVTAWGAGWNAMILCEYLEADGRVLSVRGIGATLARATYVSGDMQVVAASLASMVLLIVLVNRLFWDPLYLRVAARYRMEL